jgi:hypothetical protein
MAYKTAEELRTMIDDAKLKVRIGGTYYHYKRPDETYTLIDVIIIEATTGIGVLYRAEYDDLKGITFMRPIEDFLSEVELENQLIKKFTLVSQ